MPPPMPISPPAVNTAEPATLATMSLLEMIGEAPLTRIPPPHPSSVNPHTSHDSVNPVASPRVIVNPSMVGEPPVMVTTRRAFSPSRVVALANESRLAAPDGAPSQPPSRFTVLSSVTTVEPEPV